MQKPSFWRLLGAYAVDFFILLLIDFCWFFLTRSESLIQSLAIWIINTGYFTLLEKNGKGSWGKRIFSLQTCSASVRRVFSAYAMDWGLGLLFMLGIMLFLYKLTPDPDPLAGYLAAIFLGVPVGFLLTYLYFVTSESLSGKTLGKKLMGLQVVQETK